MFLVIMKISLLGGNNPFTGNWIRGGFGDSAVNDQGLSPLGSYNQDNLVVNMFDTIVQK